MPESWTASFKIYSRDPLAFMPTLQRDYGDVAPIRGVYKGGAVTSEHAVNVKMTRLG